jgi:hypothetical protein
MPWRDPDMDPDMLVSTDDSGVLANAGTDMFQFGGLLHVVYFARITAFALMCCCCVVLSASGPMPWCAPEVLASMGKGGSGVIATTATDMYQFGGLLHEIMTCGNAPFWWMPGTAQLLLEQRCSKDPIRIPGTTFSAPGLLGKSTLQAAALDSEPVPWRVRVEEGSEGSASRLRELVEVLEGCLEEDPVKRWKGNALYVVVGSWGCSISLSDTSLRTRYCYAC